jgi:hypothetical protein
VERAFRCIKTVDLTLPRPVKGGSRGSLSVGSCNWKN